MKIQMLWVPPAERRFSCGDILPRADLEAFGVDVDRAIATGDAQVIEDQPAPRAKRGK